MPNNEHNALDDLFSKQFENFNPPPPSGLWGNIENSLNNADFDEAFRQKLSGTEVQPSEEVWGKISKGLPLNLLLSRFLTYSSGIAGILVLGMALQYALFSYNHSSDYNTEITYNAPVYSSQYSANQYSQTNIDVLKATWKNELTDEYAAYNRQAQKNQANVNEQIANIRKRYSPEVANELVDRVISYMEHQSKSSNIENYDYASRLNRMNTPRLLNAVSPRFALKDALPNYMWFLAELPEQGSQDIVPINDAPSSNKHNVSRWAIYGSGQFGFSAIKGQKVEQAFAQNGENLNPKLSFGGQLEIGINYAINKSLSLQSGINYSQYTQRFEQASNHTNSKLNVNYWNIPVSVVYNPFNSHWSYSLGVSYGQLLHTNADNTTKNELIKHSVGMNAGVDYLQALNPNMALQIGARANWNKDLSRIYTNNLLFSLRLGLIYNIGSAIP